MREALGLHQALDADRSGPADPGEVVTAEVDEHHVLRPVLLRPEQAIGVPGARPRRARDRVDARPAAVRLHQRLRRGADEREVAELEQEEVGRRVDPTERPVQLECARRRRTLDPLREHDLERVAGADVLLRDADRALVLEAARDGDWSGRARRRRGAAPGAAGRAGPGAPPDRRRAPARARRHGRSARASRRRRNGSPASPAPAPAAARSAPARRRGRTRGSRRPASPPPRRPRLRPRESRSRRTSSARAALARPTRAGTPPHRRRAAGRTRRGA